MPAQGWRSAPTQPKSAVALGVSIALHLAAIYAVSSFAVPAPQVPRNTATRVVWLSEPRLVVRESEAALVLEELPAVEAPPDTEPSPDVEVPTELEVPPDTEELAVAELPPDTDKLPVAEAPRSAQTAPTNAPEPPPEAVSFERVESPRRNFIEPEIDWEKERRDAVAKALEEGVREQEYVTFKLRDRLDDPPAKVPAGPREHIFDSPRSSGRSVMRPGSARTRFGNWLSATCNALSGGGFGISLFGFGGLSMCAEAGQTSDFFADIRPDYLNSLPVCAEVNDAQLSPLAIARRDEIPTIKCRMVLQESP